MAAGKLHLVIEQGATFRHVLTWTDSNRVPIDLTGFTAAMQIREDYSSPTALVSLATGSGITLGGATGTITIEIAASETANLPWTGGVYDLELYNGSDVVRLVEGRVSVSKEVTR